MAAEERFDQSQITPTAGGPRKRTAAAIDSGDGDDAGVSFQQKVTRAISSVDVFPKPAEDLTVEQTTSGAAVSVISMIVIFLLTASEVIRYASVHVREHIQVDTATSASLAINFNITFPSLRCSQCRMDVMDVSGDQQVNVLQNINKLRIDSHGRAIGKPVLEVRNGLDMLSDTAGEGCNLFGELHVNRVAGNVHVALGASHARTQQHIHQFLLHDLNTFNASHTIHHLSFGQPFANAAYYGARGGGQLSSIPNPLDGVTRSTGTGGSAGTGMAHFQYFIKIVPTRFVDSSGRVVANSNQFSVTEHVHSLTAAASNADMDTHRIPGLFLIYDLSPFMIRIELYAVPFTQFFTSVCAIVGGVLTVAGIIDSVLYHSSSSLGKAGITPKAVQGVTSALLVKLTSAKAGSRTV